MAIALNLSVPSSIYDYGTLLDEFARRIDRDDLEDSFPQFVQLAERYMARKLRTMDQEVTTLLTATGETVALPADCLSIRALYIEGNSSPDYPLRGMSPSALAQEFVGQSSAIPTAYAQIGNGSLKLAPPPSDSIALSLHYIAKFTPLTASATANWIVEEHPDVYFYGVLAQACDFIQDNENAGKYAQLFGGAVDDLVRARRKDRWGSGPLVPNTVRQVRGVKC